jgi:ribosome maturation factor RimP
MLLKLLYLDDNGVALQDCIDVSRAIEANLDEKSKIFL